MQPPYGLIYLYQNEFNQNFKIMTNKMFSSTARGIIAILILAFSFPSFSADDPYLTKTFNLSSGELYVATSGGSIKVNGGNSNQVKVEMYVRSNKHSDKKIREIIEEDYEIRIEKTGSRIEAVAKREGSGWGWNNISISFVVYTPKDFECDLNTSGGSLKISGVSGRNHELKTSGGSITAEDMSGVLEARTSGGSELKSSGMTIKPRSRPGTRFFFFWSHGISRATGFPALDITISSPA